MVGDQGHLLDHTMIGVEEEVPLIGLGGVHLDMFPEVHQEVIGTMDYVLALHLGGVLLLHYLHYHPPMHMIEDGLAHQVRSFFMCVCLYLFFNCEMLVINLKSFILNLNCFIFHTVISGIAKVYLFLLINRLLSWLMSVETKVVEFLK